MWTSTSSMQSVFQSLIRLPWHQQTMIRKYVLPFKGSCSALMMSIRELSNECMFKLSYILDRSWGTEMRDVSICAIQIQYFSATKIQYFSAGSVVKRWDYMHTVRSKPAPSDAGNGILSELIALSRNRACLCRPSTPESQEYCGRPGFWDTEFRPPGMLFVELSRVELTRQVC